jgi:hypothetical protein
LVLARTSYECGHLAVETTKISIMKRLEQKAEERKERLNLLFEEAEAIDSLIKAETNKFDLLIKQSEQTRLAIQLNTGELELL